VLAGDAMRVVLAESLAGSEGDTRLGEILQSHSSGDDTGDEVTLAVGPEGGWATGSSRGFTIWDGSRPRRDTILRAENGGNCRDGSCF